MDRPWIALVSAVGGKHTEAFLSAARHLARIEVVNPGEIGVDLERDRVRLRVRGTALPPYDGAIFRRIDPHKSFDFQIQVLKLWEDSLRASINSVAGMLMALDKLAVAVRLKAAGLPMPATMVVPDVRSAEEKVRAEGILVAKPLYGSMGEGVELWRPADGLKQIIADFLTDFGAVMLQEYIPNDGRDVRVFVVGDEAVAACTRRATEGEWRTNVAQGGIPTPLPVTTEMEDLAVRAVRAVGLDYSGVDMIESPTGWRILEVNGAPSFDGLAKATGVDVARLVLEHLVKKIQSVQARAA